MREIKFRAWSKKEKCFMDIDQMEIQFLNNELIVGITREYGTHDDFEHLELMQFTGLKDKNGNEIYEGDIVSVCNGSINGVNWMDKPKGVKFIANAGFILPMFCWDSKGNNQMDSTHWVEIIGNIYENSDLLK